MLNEAWTGFKKGRWTNKIDLRNFITLNYEQYDGNADFLEKPTQRTLKVLTEVKDLLKKECDAGGVLDIDVSNISSILSWKPGYILNKDEELIYGLQTDKPLKRSVNPFGGIKMSVSACEEYGYKLDPTLVNAFKYRTTHNDGVFRVYTEEMRKVRKSGVITGLPDAYGRGRIIGDYRRLPLYGMNYLIDQKVADKNALGTKAMSENNIRLCEELFKQIQFMQELIKMAAEYGDDITKPAKTAREAIQWLYYAYLGAVKEQNGAANSVGRISTFIDIYIQRDIKLGILNEVSAQEIIDDLVIKFRLVRHLRTSAYNDLFAGDPVWVTMSECGVTLDGRHMVTKTAYRVLQTLYNLDPSAEPNITILWSEHLPENYKLFCAQVSIDTDSIQYENDDVMRIAYGDDYAIACCVSALKTGKQTQYFGARCNLTKVLLMALNGGRDEISGVMVGPEGNIFDSKKLNYDEVLTQYDKYSSWLANLYVNTLNVIHFMHDKYAYERLMMSFHDTVVERLMAFGICGLSVLVDSLSAIKYASVTPVKNEAGLIIDYITEGDFPKYGNDDDRADDIARWVVEDFYAKLLRTKTYRNAKHTLSVLTITSNVVYGKKTGSTPDGRKLGEPFAPGANPMHRRDECGAMASLNSVAKLRFDCCRDGISNTFTVTPDVLGSSPAERADRLVSLIDGYFLQEAHHLNVNVLNRAKLVDAMEHPENYPNLTIRVSGYAVNFNKLNKKQQAEVINRTFHSSL
ncbi:MAG: formate C-acetyltransferase [Christensenellaceae bacterium]|jgi:formate C-acetyltransferase|nr:formate C-acetyltransferase [Christensenellaceae bacterium]